MLRQGRTLITPGPDNSPNGGDREIEFSPEMSIEHAPAPSSADASSASGELAAGAPGDASAVTLGKEEARPGVCPFCLSPAPEGATKCAHCGANIGDIQICPGCGEPVRETATLCPFCRGDLLPPAYAEEGGFLSEPWVIESSPVGAFLTDQSITALFYPPVMTITPSEIRIRRRMFLGMRTLDSKISVSRIASVRTLDGVIWGGLVIETYGGASGDLSIGGLDKDEARQTAVLIEKLAETAPMAKSDRS